MVRTIKIPVAGRWDDYEYRTFRYEERDDGWYVDEGDGFERRFIATARERDVKQLLRKEYDVRY